MSGALGKKLTAKDNRPAINDRYKWVAFHGLPGEDVDFEVNCLVRTSLTNSEIEALIGFSGQNEELWELVHPYVKEWDIIWSDGKDRYEVLPPAEGGAESFRYATSGLVYAIVNSLTSEPFSKIDPKSSTPAESTE
jgi:hypothetical protein